MPVTQPSTTNLQAETLQSTLLITVRTSLALFISLLFSPLTLPIVFFPLPATPAFHFLERITINILTLLSNFASVDAKLAPRSSTTSKPHPWLPAPLLRVWTSPLPRSRYVTTYDQPGRWMSDTELDQLRSTLVSVAESSIGKVPTHRLFKQSSVREAFSNRVISVAYDAHGPIGFVAMVYLQVPGDIVMHLGLTMMGARGKRQRLQSLLFTKCLAVPVLNLRRPSYHVTNCAASPAGIGSVSDYFLDVYPTYDGPNLQRSHHRHIAMYVLDQYRFEFGCSKNAVFDPDSFVVYRSNQVEGGGTHQFIMEDGIPVSRHRSEKCNQFVANQIDFSQGDELFQVATVSALGSALKYLTVKMRKPK